MKFKITSETSYFVVSKDNWFCIIAKLELEKNVTNYLKFNASCLDYKYANLAEIFVTSKSVNKITAS